MLNVTCINRSEPTLAMVHRASLAANLGCSGKASRVSHSDSIKIRGARTSGDRPCLLTGFAPNPRCESNVLMVAAPNGLPPQERPNHCKRLTKRRFVAPADSLQRYAFVFGNHRRLG